MKLFLVIALTTLTCCNCYAQHRQYAFYELYQLDSLAETSNISRHFGHLYYQFLSLVEKKLEKADSVTRNHIRRFESVFARFYIEACVSFQKNEKIQHPSWQTYFQDTTLTKAQYFLLGANAHLNGQLAEAIKNTYTTEEWKLLKSKYPLFNSCLNKTYRLVYHETMKSSQRARWLHRLSLGMAKVAGNIYLYKWRKRQMRLAKLYFRNSNRYKPLMEKVSAIKSRIDRMIVTQL